MLRINFSKIEAEHLILANQRGIEATYCPSEIARKMFPENWREQMHNVRLSTDNLVKKEMLVTLQKGKLIEELPSEAKGPIRLRINNTK